MDDVVVAVSGWSIVLVAIILIFMVGYISSQFVAGGKTFASGFNIAPSTGILITAGIVLY